MEYSYHAVIEDKSGNTIAVRSSTYSTETNEIGLVINEIENEILIEINLLEDVKIRIVQLINLN